MGIWVIDSINNDIKSRHWSDLWIDTRTTPKP